MSMKDSTRNFLAGDDSIVARYERLVANAFGGHEARLSIPARPDHDDDLVVGRWIRNVHYAARDLLGELNDPGSVNVHDPGNVQPLMDRLAELVALHAVATEVLHG